MNNDTPMSPVRKRASKRISLGPPSFIHSGHNRYTQQKNRTPTRSGSRVTPALGSPELNQSSFNMGIRSEEDNSTTYDDLSYEEDHRRLGFRLNLFRSNHYRSRDSSLDDENQIQNDDDSISLDQWPICSYEDDHIIFTDNKVYIGYNDNQSFKCFNIKQPDTNDEIYGRNTEEKGEPSKRELVFEKVNYEKYKKTSNATSSSRVLNFNGGDLSSSLEQQHQKEDDTFCYQRRTSYDQDVNDTAFADYGSNYLDTDRFVGEERWKSKFQDCAVWSDHAGEKEGEFAGKCFRDKTNDGSPWSRGVYNNRDSSRNEDSGIICDNTFENSIDFKDTTQGGDLNECSASMDVDSWAVLKRKVFEVEPGRHANGSRMCGSSNNSLCTLSTWVDDECFDNSFNEELERRCSEIDRRN